MIDATYDPEEFAEVSASVAKVARRYHSKCPWFSAEELAQAAWPDVLVALDSHDEARASLAWFVAEVARRAMLRHVFALGSCVSGTKHRPDVVAHVRRVPAYSQDPGSPLDGARALPAAPDDPERDVGEAAWRAEVRARVQAVLGAAGAAFAFGVVTGEHTPADVAAHHGVSLGRAKEASRAVRAALLADPALYTLWKDAPT